jgi:endonuclease III related protein
MVNRLMDIYDSFLKMYGPQGWWPLLELNNNTSINITKSGSLNGYHPKDYSYPKTDNQRLEVCIGAILTQNTTWLQVEKALTNLKRINALTIKGIKRLSDGKLKELIKCAGYYNQKARKIKLFVDFFFDLNGRTPKREELLNVWGIGEETADSILLYAYRQLEFVIDAYTRRILTNLGLIDEKASYHEIKELFEKNLPKDLIIYQEYHALLVEHAKRYYRKKPYEDPLKNH